MTLPVQKQCLRHDKNGTGKRVAEAHWDEPRARGAGATDIRTQELLGHTRTSHMPVVRVLLTSGHNSCNRLKRSPERCSPHGSNSGCIRGAFLLHTISLLDAQHRGLLFFYQRTNRVELAVRLSHPLHIRRIQAAGSSLVPGQDLLQVTNRVSDGNNLWAANAAALHGGKSR